MLSTIPESTPEPHSSTPVNASRLLSANPAMLWDSASSTPVLTSPPTITNSPMKNASVDHSTSCSASSVVTRETATSSPAPSRATTDGS